MGEWIFWSIVLLGIALALNYGIQSIQRSVDGNMENKVKHFMRINNINIPGVPFNLRYASGLSIIDNYLYRNGLTKYKKIFWNTLVWRDITIMHIALSPVASSTDLDGYSSDYIEPEISNVVLNDNSHITSFYVNNISYFSRVGELYTLTRGGGTDIGGAIAGGLIAGGVGAIVGGRGRIDTKVVDERNTLLVVDREGVVENILFDPKAYDVFMKMIPDKHYETVSLNTTALNNQTLSNASQNDDIVRRLEQLAVLKEKGIISTDEYTEKRKYLLDKL